MILAAVALAFAQQPVDLVEDVGIDQRLGATLPLDRLVRTEDGAEVRLGDVFGERPVVLALVYYECPMLCTLVLEGLLESLRPLPFAVGREFDVVALSIDPGETPELARAKEKNLVAAYGDSASAPGWHLLTASEDSIAAIAEAVGFRYAYDPVQDEFAHAAGLQVVTPDGRLSRYFYGVEISSRDLRLGLVEASEGRIGSLADAVLLWCYHYDPLTGEYGFAILSTIRVLGVLTVAVLGAFVIRHLRRERALARREAALPG